MKPKKLSYEAYQKQFRGNKRERALERAWKNRDFEIGLYWKRATYFWAFIATTFAGYFVTIKHDYPEHPFLELVVAILGFVFSLSWYLVNKGSKKWQENWEHHIDMLEEQVTGPIYKTVLRRKAPSVSGVNQKVSFVVMLIWSFLILDYYFGLSDTCNAGLKYGDILLFLLLIWFVQWAIGIQSYLKKVVCGKKKKLLFETRRWKYKKVKD